MVIGPLCQRHTLGRCARSAPWPAAIRRYARFVPYTRVSDPEKLRRLLAAVLVLTSDVELPHLLRTSITEACSLVGARYGALGVLNEPRTGLEQFLTVGWKRSRSAPSAPGRPVAASSGS